MKHFLIFLITFSLLTPICAQLNYHLYSTWDTVEFDTCSSAWLIKRFVNKDAEFKFFPKGELITEGIPFDTPDAELRRKDNMSTYEIILKKHKIEDPILVEIGKIIHEVEISYWGETSQISKEIGKKIANIIAVTENKSECFQESFKVFDNLYEELRASLKLTER